MAERLGVERTTVYWRLNSVYRKLGASWVYRALLEAHLRGEVFVDGLLSY